MKKTLLAAALTVGFFGVAQAETSVTLYGIVDVGVGYQKVSGSSSRVGGRAGNNLDSKRIGLVQDFQNGNRWGLKGSEDLGDGLRAVFVLESGFTISDGQQAQGGRLFGRQATLGLAGDSWGQLDFGRQTNITSKYFVAIDPFGAAFNQANVGAAFTAANTVRYDNMVMYQSPNFSGFQFGAGYSFNADGKEQWDKDVTIGGTKYNNKDLNKRAVTTGLRYANGPVNVALTYEQMKAGNPADNVTLKSWNLGGAYDFEVVKVSLAFGQTRNGLFGAQTFGDVSGVPQTFVGQRGLKVNSYLVGATAPIGNGKLMASWHMADPRSAPDAAPGNFEYDKQQGYSLGYIHNLSKRTTVYAIGSYVKHVHFLPDAKATLFAVGLRHAF
ncbi:porin [Alcaligenaceae bacterium]|nr:porin [Alcaligenaceae bacterium]